ncbi:MAG: hypothetical protein M3O46_23530 [Myxococcota bacterium]|nr:hypothetical protein [Myxococcota bacterium]
MVKIGLLCALAAEVVAGCAPSSPPSLVDGGADGATTTTAPEASNDGTMTNDAGDGSPRADDAGDAGGDATTTAPEAGDGSAAVSDGSVAPNDASDVGTAICATEGGLYGRCTAFASDGAAQCAQGGPPGVPYTTPVTNAPMPMTCAAAESCCPTWCGGPGWCTPPEVHCWNAAGNILPNPCDPGWVCCSFEGPDTGAGG